MAVQFNRKSEPKFAVLVTGDIGSFSKGDILTKEDDIAQYFRDMLDTNDVTWNKDDDALIAVAKSIPMPTINEGETTEQVAMEWEEEVCGALISQNSSNADVTGRDVLPDLRSSVDVAVSQTRGSLATVFGEELDKNEGFRTALHDASDAAIGVKRAGLVILLATLAADGVSVGIDGKPDKWVCKMNKFPDGSSKPSEAYCKEHNLEPGFVRKEDQNLFAQYKLNAKGGSFTYKWYDDFVASTAEGKEEQKQIQEFTAGKPTKTNVNGEGKYKGRPVYWLEDKIRLYSVRFNAKVQYTKHAANAWKNMATIASHPVLSKYVDVGFTMVKAGDPKCEVTDGPQPIWIADKMEGGVRKSYTISAFGNLDLDVALERGGTYKDVVESTKIGPDEPPADMQEPLNPDTVVPVLYELHQFSMLNPNLNALTVKGNVKAGKGETSEAGFSVEANDLVVSVYETITRLENVMRVWGEQRYQSILAARRAKEAEVRKGMKEDAA